MRLGVASKAAGMGRNRLMTKLQKSRRQARKIRFERGFLPFDRLSAREQQEVAARERIAALNGNRALLTQIDQMDARARLALAKPIDPIPQLRKRSQS